MEQKPRRKHVRLKRTSSKNTSHRGISVNMEIKINGTAENKSETNACRRFGGSMSLAINREQYGAAVAVHKCSVATIDPKE